MPRKKGPDIRNGNWLFYNNQLLATPTGVTDATKEQLRTVGPEELQRIIAKSEDLIFTTLTYGAWLYTAKMVVNVDGSSEAARGNVLTADAYDEPFSRMAYYDINDFTETSRPYWQKMHALGIYSTRLLLGLDGWNEVYDGGWLQIQPNRESLTLTN